MAGLAEKLLGGAEKDRVIAECVQLVEGYVAGRGGLKGIGMRAGLSMLRAAKPDIVERATSRLLPGFLDAVDPLHARFAALKKKPGFEAFLVDHGDTAAAALMGVADARVAASTNGTLKSSYARFRGGAEKEVLTILPTLGRIIERRL